MINIATTLALFGSMGGALLVARQHKSGFYVWLVSNMLWLNDSYARGDIQQSVLWIYYNITCIIGIRTWKS